MKKIRRFKIGKLVRDNIDRLFMESGAVRITSKELSAAEFDAALRLKVYEEADEVRRVVSDDELVNECADLVEVLMALIALRGKSWDDVQVAIEKKAFERGRYQRRLFIDVVDLPEDSEAVKHYASNPQKYPELLCEGENGEGYPED